MEVIEHLYQPRAFVLFIRSILEASGGGQFIVTTPYHGYLKTSPSQRPTRWITT